MSDTIERVFGRGRLQMATGNHVEVFREAVAPGERRRYTKRFLETGDADFRQWTQREWRMLARLIGHGVRCVPDVVQFDGGSKGGLRQVQTYDAGVTVDQWATLLPVSRDGATRRHIFEDCAHWWALAHHCLAALDEIHRLQLVHLDIKADNICIPYDPPTFDPLAPDARVYPAFARLALIDFAFSLVSREPLHTALPLGWQKDYDYQSPRLLRALAAGLDGDLGPTQELDWRCDIYSLAAMLRRYLPQDARARREGAAPGWTATRYEAARTLIYRLRDAHDGELGSVAPHVELMQFTSAQLAADDLAHSLTTGWSLALQDNATEADGSITPLTRIAAPRPTATPALPAPMTAITEVPAVFRSTRIRVAAPAAAVPRGPTLASRRPRAQFALAASLAAALIGATIPLVFGDRLAAIGDLLRAQADDVQAIFAGTPAANTNVSSTPVTPAPAAAPAKPVEVPRESAAPPREIPAPPTESHPIASDTRRQPITPQPSRDAAVASTPRPRAQPHAHPRSTPDVHFARPVAPTTVQPPSSVDLAAAAKATRSLVISSLPSAEELAAAMPKARQPNSRAATIAAPAPTQSANAATSTASTLPASDTTPSAAGATDVQPPSARATVVQDSPPTRLATEQPWQSAPAEPRPARRRTPEATPVEPWRLALGEMMAALTLTQAQPAPVEDRTVVGGSLPRANQRTRGPTRPAAPPDEANGVNAPVVPQETPEMLLHQAQNLLRADLPRIAAQAHNDVADLLWTAAGADSPSQDRVVRTAAVARWPSERMHVSAAGNVARARQLYGDARHAFASGRDHDALQQALRAFATNPRDADIAGFLAMLYLRVPPMQAERSRQLALYALALSGSSRNVRHDDWNTFAVASALSGHEADAERALLAELALTTDVDRSCRAALGAYSMFGERMRAPVQTLMSRVHAQGRARDSISCRWSGIRFPARYAAGNEARF